MTSISYFNKPNIPITAVLIPSPQAQEVQRPVKSLPTHNHAAGPSANAVSLLYCSRIFNLFHSLSALFQSNFPFLSLIVNILIFYIAITIAVYITNIMILYFVYLFIFVRIVLLVTFAAGEGGEEVITQISLQLIMIHSFELIILITLIKYNLPTLL